MKIAFLLALASLLASAVLPAAEIADDDTTMGGKQITSTDTKLHGAKPPKVSEISVIFR